MHLEKFFDSVEFQSWKVNFKTEVCSKSAYLHLTMHWTKEVEKAKSMDELVTSRSITGRRDFTDCDMLDAMIASAFEKASHECALLEKSKCGRAACSERRSILTRQIAYMIFGHFRATGAYAAVQGLRFVQCTFAEW